VKRAICRRAFDLGITHFDLANNYGPPPGSAETAFGEILRTDFAGYRDELIISTKAGYGMWPGPYGEWGSRKYLLASLDQSLKRMGSTMSTSSIRTASTPTRRSRKRWARSTMRALGQGALCRHLLLQFAAHARGRAILRDLGTPCLIHQPSYSMINRWIEDDGLLDTLDGSASARSSSRRWRRAC
jgi:L-glyceraldehyde 3-phosphate reductase